jgi:hypothetical protein
MSATAAHAPHLRSPTLQQRKCCGIRRTYIQSGGQCFVLRCCHRHQPVAHAPDLLARGGHSRRRAARVGREPRQHGGEERRGGLGARARHAPAAPQAERRQRLLGRRQVCDGGARRAQPGRQARQLRLARRDLRMCRDSVLTLWSLHSTLHMSRASWARLIWQHGSCLAATKHVTAAPGARSPAAGRAGIAALGATVRVAAARMAGCDGMRMWVTTKA